MSKTRVITNKPNNYYHVMTRTAQRAFLLEDPAFKQEVDQIIKAFAEIYYVDIQNWTYMDNHYHLCINIKKPAYDQAEVRRRFELMQEQCTRPRRWYAGLGQRLHKRFSNLSKFMWEINRRTAIAFNTKHGTGGHFWGARFKSRPLEGDQEILAVMAYIEQNAVRCKPAKAARPSAYPFCTAGVIAAALAAGIPVEVPRIGFLRHRAVEDRARAYVIYMDHVSALAMNPLKRTEQAPPEVVALSLPGDLSKTIEALRAGTPAAWGSGTIQP